MSKVEIIKNYCAITKKLIGYYHKKTNDIDKDKYKNRAFIFIDTTPDQVLEITGPALFKRRDAIIKDDTDTLISDIKSQECNIEDDDGARVLHSIIQILDQSNTAEKNIILKDIKELTNLYIRYLILCK